MNDSCSRLDSTAARRTCTLFPSFLTHSPPRLSSAAAAFGSSDGESLSALSERFDRCGSAAAEQCHGATRRQGEGENSTAHRQRRSSSLAADPSSLSSTLLSHRCRRRCFVDAAAERHANRHIRLRRRRAISTRIASILFAVDLSQQTMMIKLHSNSFHQVLTPRACGLQLRLAGLGNLERDPDCSSSHRS